MSLGYICADLSSFKYKIKSEARSFRYIEQSCQLPVSVSVLMLITRDRQTYPRIQQLQQQLSTVSAAIFPAQLTFFCVLADL